MLEKTLTPADFEAKLYEGWESSGAFSARPDSPAQPSVAGRSTGRAA